MDYMKRFVPKLGAVLLILTAFPQVAYAYLDPGTGSYIFQVLVGALFGAMFALKMFWRNIRSFFSNILARRAKD